MREKILTFIEKNSRIDLKELAIVLGVDETTVMNELEKMEEEHIICGYHTLIDWDKAGIEKVTALIEVRVTPQRGMGFDKVAERIYNYPEVNSVYLISGGFDFMVTIGGSEAIDAAMRAMLDPGDEVLIPQPSYVSYVPCAVLAGGVPVIIELKAENEFRLTPEALEAAITPKTKLLVMPFPNNPTGAIMEKKDLEKIADIVREHDLYVISDEIYSELTYLERHVTIASLQGMRDRTIVINGFSKSHAMTGWRLGYACGPRIIIEQMLKIHQFAIMCAPSTSQYAGVEALRNGDEDVAAMREEYNGRRRYLLHRFKEMGLSCFEPFGAFYVFPCIKEFGMTSEEFATKLLNQQKLAVVPGTAFGDCGEGFVRISYAYSLDNLKKAMNRMEAFITDLRKRS